jgi:4,4'-diaponeurosporenoate glycosyltransferase
MGSGSIILSVASLLWFAGFLILSRIRTYLPSAHFFHPSLSLSVIIPARNEEHNLPRLLHSINAQSVRPLEVIVVDDASTDRTAEVAEKLGATVIASQPLPEEWRGKTWACQQGANFANGDILLFIDADTWFETGGLERILAAYDTGALSVGPYHTPQRPYEQLSAFFNLIMAAGTVPHGLFGQMLMVDRASYRRIDGHETVKGRILENFFLAERFCEFGIPLHGQTGKGLLGFRMYPNGLSDLIEGWTKGFASGAGQTAKPTLLLIVAWLIGMMLPVGWLPFSEWATLLYLLFAAQLAFMFRQVGAFRWYTALFYPVPLVFFFALFAWSLLRSDKQVTWKGRRIHAN